MRFRGEAIWRKFAREFAHTQTPCLGDMPSVYALLDTSLVRYET